MRLDQTKEAIKWDMFKSADTFKHLRWKYWLSTTVAVKWPMGWAPIDGRDDLAVESADPDDWYRWWLEKNVGRQGWSWDWRVSIHPNPLIDVYDGFFKDELEIRFRNPKHATMFMLRYG